VLEVNQVGLELCHKTDKAGFNLSVQKCVKELACHAGMEASWVAGHPPREYALGFLILLAKGRATIVVPEKDGGPVPIS
jgi:hypothetical protein